MAEQWAGTACAGATGTSPSRAYPSPCPSPPPLFANNCDKTSLPSASRTGNAIQYHSMSNPSNAADDSPVDCLPLPIVASVTYPPPLGFSSSCSSPVPPPFPFLSPEAPSLDPLRDTSSMMASSICSLLPPPVMPDSVVLPDNAALPPPPPPPLLPQSVGLSPGGAAKISPAALRGVDNSQRIYINSEQLIAECINRLVNFHPELRGRQLSYLNRTTCAQLQQGPQCGIVALSIAANSLLANQTGDVSPDTLQKSAVKRGFSKQGEMFSVENMAELARIILHPGVNVSIERVEVLADDDFLWRSFRNGDLFLVPYDCDFNHEPCLAQGKKAHWALLTGLLVASHSMKAAEPVNLADHQLLPEGQLLLLARQSKSLVQGGWIREDLICSCNNLKTMASHRSLHHFVVPSGGVEEGLCGRILHLSKQ